MENERNQPLARDAMAYVLAGGRGSRLKELTDRRAKPAVYFGGKTRIIDFALSNALNSGIRRLGVATQYKAHSLIRHLQRGWNFLRPERNESFDILPASQRVSETQWYEGTADAVYQNIDIIESLRPRIHGHAGRRPHLQDGLRADAAPARRRRRRRHGRLPRSAAHGGDRLRRHACRQEGQHHLLHREAGRPARHPRQARPRAGLDGHLRLQDEVPDGPAAPRRRPGPDRAAISARTSSPTSSRTAKRSPTASPSPACARAQETEAYWRDVGTVDAYWEANIDLTDITPELDLYDRDWPIWTYAELKPPAKFVHDEDGRRGMAVSSLVSGDCIVSGASLQAQPDLHRRAHQLLFDARGGRDAAGLHRRPRRAPQASGHRPWRR